MPHDHHDHTGHGHHGHSHAHIDPNAGDARLIWAIVVNMGLTLAQVVGGILSGSLALIADALHNFSDAIALIIAIIARRIARRPATPGMSFGYGRAEVVAALVNYTTLIVLALYLIYEGVLRALAPEPIDGWMVVWIAGIALSVDLVTAALTYSMSKDSMNIRAAFLHNLADALGSVAVILAGTFVILWGYTWVDPLATLLIAGYILWHVATEIGGGIRGLMLGSPPQIDMTGLAGVMEETDGVAGVHHLHVWQMQENETTLEAHVQIEPGRWFEADAIKARLKQQLGDRFGIDHSTLELECANHACRNPRQFGHG